MALGDCLLLVFTMVADGESSLVVWSKFYHFSLDDVSLGLLLAQGRKIVQILMICKPGGHQDMADSYIFAQTILWQKYGVIGSFTLKWRPCQRGRRFF